MMEKRNASGELLAQSLIYLQSQRMIFLSNKQGRAFLILPQLWTTLRSGDETVIFRGTFLAKSGWRRRHEKATAERTTTGTEAFA